MHGTRHRRTAPAGRILLLVSSLALLAFTLFPVLAQASGSAESVYETDPVPQPHHQQHEPVAKSSTESGGTPSAPTGSEGTPTTEGSGGVPSQEVETSSNSPERHQSSPEAGQGKNHEKVAQGNPVSPTPTPASDGGGGSSPLVPILIALAVLAAISIGVYVMRQRQKSDSDGGLSAPRAG